MVQGGKNSAAVANAPTNSNEGEEIDRIMKEIEDLEKKMDTPPSETSEDPTQAQTQPPAPPAEAEAPAAKVVPMRQSAPAPVAESLAESDAVPVSDEPLIRESSDASGEGSLALKIGG